MANKLVVAIIQARMSSSRLPGKVLANLNGQSVLEWIVRRARRAQMIDEVVVATTISDEDDAVADFCQRKGIAFSRGSMHDVLDRYYQSAKRHQADVVVRITGDCPLIDPAMLDANLTTFLQSQPPLDFAANRLPGDRTVPIGLDTEICTFKALETAWMESQQPHQREHVMPFLYENPDRFRVLHIRHTPDYGHLRWTVDTPEDLALLQEVCAQFEDDAFSWEAVLELFERRPELAAINASVAHKSQFDVDERK